MRYGEIRQALEREELGWQLSPYIDDNAEVELHPVSPQDVPLEAGQMPPDGVQKAAEEVGNDPGRLLAAVDYGLMTADEAQRRLETDWGPDFRLDEFRELT